MVKGPGSFSDLREKQVFFCALTTRYESLQTLTVKLGSRGVYLPRDRHLNNVRLGLRTIRFASFG